MTRKITQIVVHCTATREGDPHTVADIDRWHKAKGWSSCGYHWVIGLNGEIWMGRPEESVGAHAYGHNKNSIGVVYVGGLATDGKTPKDTRTPAQLKAMRQLLVQLHQRYPSADILGHRDLSEDKDGDGVVEPFEWTKACPCFYVGQWVREQGILAAVKE